MKAYMEIVKLDANDIVTASGVCPGECGTGDNQGSIGQCGEGELDCE